MSVRKVFRKLTAVILVIAMVCPTSITSLASAGGTVEVEGTQLSEDLIPEDKNIVYFGATSLTVTEKEMTYTLPVYRTGSEEYLSRGTSFTIHSQDISALYGKDYRLLGEGRTEMPHEKTILEMVTGEDNSKTTEKTYWRKKPAALTRSG